MAKALTTQTRAAKVTAQEKVVARLTARRDKAAKTLATVEAPLRFEQARLVHLQNTPVVDDIVDNSTEPTPADQVEEVTELSFA